MLWSMVVLDDVRCSPQMIDEVNPAIVSIPN